MKYAPNPIVITVNALTSITVAVAELPPNSPPITLALGTLTFPKPEIVETKWLYKPNAVVSVVLLPLTV